MNRIVYKALYRTSNRTFHKVTFLHALRSEITKLHHSSLISLHLVLAVVLGGLAGAYFSFSAWDSMLGTDAFFQLLGAGVPLLVGISCGLALETEREAGDYANLLGVPSRTKALFAKGIILFILLLAAALCAMLLFFGILTVAGRALPSFSACTVAVFGIALGSVSLYAISLFVAFRFGRNVSIGLGALGFLAAMASMGGLANGLVTGTLSGSIGADVATFIPFAWPSRFASLCIELAIAQTLPEGSQVVTLLISTFKQIGITCIVTTFAFTFFIILWINRYEDKRQNA